MRKESLAISKNFRKDYYWYRDVRKNRTLLRFTLKDRKRRYGLDTRKLGCIKFLKAIRVSGRPKRVFEL